MSVLIIRSGRVSSVQHLPEIANQLGMLELLLVTQMGQLNDLIGPNQIRMLLLMRYIRVRRAIHLDGSESEVGSYRSRGEGNVAQEQSRSRYQAR